MPLTSSQAIAARGITAASAASTMAYVRLRFGAGGDAGGGAGGGASQGGGGYGGGGGASTVGIVKLRTRE